MICVSIEVREGALTRRVRITAPSIERALGIASAGKPGREVRPLFPIDPESFFVPENPDRGRRLEMGLSTLVPKKRERRRRRCGHTHRRGDDERMQHDRAICKGVRAA